MLAFPRLLLAAIVAAAALVLPATASAGTLAVDKPCVRTDQTVGFTASGFAPGSLDLLLNGDYLSAVDIGADGSFAGTFPAPGLGDTYAQTFTLSSRAGGAAAFGVTTIGAVQVPAAPKPGGKVKLTAYGFVEGGPLYAHYVYKVSEVKRQVKRTVKLGSVTGPCGNLTKKVAALPIKKPKAGVWFVQVDGRPAYKKQVAPFAELSVFVPPTRK